MVEIFPVELIYVFSKMNPGSRSVNLQLKFSTFQMKHNVNVNLQQEMQPFTIVCNKEL